MYSSIRKGWHLSITNWFKSITDPAPIYHSLLRTARHYWPSSSFKSIKNILVGRGLCRERKLNRNWPVELVRFPPKLFCGAAYKPKLKRHRKILSLKLINKEWIDAVWKAHNLVRYDSVLPSTVAATASWYCWWQNGILVCFVAVYVDMSTRMFRLQKTTFFSEGFLLASKYCCLSREFDREPFSWNLKYTF